MKHVRQPWVILSLVISLSAAATLGPAVVRVVSRGLANQALAAGQPARAVGLLGPALALQPRSAVLHDALGAALYAQGQVVQALNEFQQAVQLDPTLVAAQNNLGVALLALGRPSAAGAALTTATQLNPGLATAFTNLGYAQRAGGQREAALAAFRHAADLDPQQMDARLQWAALMFEDGALVEAQRAWQEVLTVAPPQPAALAGLGAVAVRQGQPAAALAFLDAAAALAPETASTHYYSGLAWQALQRPDKARLAFMQALRWSQEPTLQRLARTQLLALPPPARSDEALPGNGHF